MKKSYWIYGLTMGVLLLVLQVIEYKTMIRDMRIEVLGLMVGLLFLGFGIWVGSQLMDRKKNRRIKSGQVPSDLSDRELEVLGLMAEGLSNQEIADALFVSLNTVKTHISNIYLKLHVKRRTQAVQKARELNIIVELTVASR